MPSGINILLEGDKDEMNEARRSLYVIYNKLATDIAEVELKRKETKETYEYGVYMGMSFAFTQVQEMVMKAIKEGRNNETKETNPGE